MTDILFTELQTHNICQKKNTKHDITNIPSHLHISDLSLL